MISPRKAQGLELEGLWLVAKGKRYIMIRGRARVSHARVARSISIARSTTCKVTYHEEIYLWRARVGREADIDTSPLAELRVAKSFLRPSMAFWSPQGARDNIFVCPRSITTRVHILDLNLVLNNHSLYHDTMPLNKI